MVLWAPTSPTSTLIPDTSSLTDPYISARMLDGAGGPDPRRHHHQRDGEAPWATSGQPPPPISRVTFNGGPHGVLSCIVMGTFPGSVLCSLAGGDGHWYSGAQSRFHTDAAFGAPVEASKQGGCRSHLEEESALHQAASNATLVVRNFTQVLQCRLLTVGCCQTSKFTC